MLRSSANTLVVLLFQRLQHMNTRHTHTLQRVALSRLVSATPGGKKSPCNKQDFIFLSKRCQNLGTSTDALIKSAAGAAECWRCAAPCAPHEPVYSAAHASGGLWKMHIDTKGPFLDAPGHFRGVTTNLCWLFSPSPPLSLPPPLLPSLLLVFKHLRRQSETGPTTIVPEWLKPLCNYPGFYLPGGGPRCPDVERSSPASAVNET